MEKLKNSCRICLDAEATNVNTLLISIFKTESHNLNSDFSVDNALQVICGLEVKEDDPFPKQICAICVSALEQAYNLRQQSHRTHEQLLSLLSGNDSPNEQIEEYEVEYLDFEPEQESADGSMIIEYIEDCPQSDPEDTNDGTDYEQEIRLEVTEILKDKPHACCGCDASYATESGLKKHAARTHRANRPTEELPADRFSCNVCYGVFNRRELRAHRVGKNTIQQWEKCDFCGCNFATLRGLGKHRNRFHKDRCYRCCRCEFSTMIRGEFLAHSSSHEQTSGVDSGGRFSCSICHGKFETISSKRLHERYPYRVPKDDDSVATDGKVSVQLYRCCGCPKVFSTLDEIRSHRLEVHLPQRSVASGGDESSASVECGGCYKCFKNKALLNRHLQKATVKKLYSCSKCSVTRRTLQELMEHEAIHTGGGAFLCCGCREGFESREALEDHSRKVHANRPKVYHNDEEDTERPFECTVCYRRYKSAKDLRGHQRFVYYEKVHTCSICGKGFAQEHSLAVHQATHKASPDFPCPVCGKQYKHEASVRSCVSRHERPRQHRCKICDVIFPAASNLYSHMISHSNERRHKCDECGQSFKRSFHLRKHQKMHSREKNHHCRYCPMRFITTTELYKHEIRHTGQYPYQCSICARKLTTRQNFIKHYEAHMDPAAKVFGCHLCLERYSEEHFLSNHIKYKHGIEPQDKNWNDKFNRQGPVRMKGGLRVAGVEGKYGASEYEQEEGVDEQVVEYVEEVLQEAEIHVD